MPDDITEYFAHTGVTHTQSQTDYQYLNSSRNSLRNEDEDEIDAKNEKAYHASGSKMSTRLIEESTFEEPIQVHGDDSSSSDDEDKRSNGDRGSRFTRYDADEDLKKYSKWRRFYLKYIILDRSLADISILDSFMYNSDLKPVEEERRVWSW
ncbi:hypothetical protein C6P45_005391 [Maudiozyma exigua]|uniref:Uncharacterized protein n=1 Tax=Maudiozyma exigua TaxID=34358 RepID=A0A9P7B9N0_MAUEX|nr:hypothetical protein C6P45_005391 [Kazachstania exigua]